MGTNSLVNINISGTKLRFKIYEKVASFGKESNTALFFKQSLIAKKASAGKSSTSSYIEHISTLVTTQELREATKKGRKQQKIVIVKIDL